MQKIILLLLILTQLTLNKTSRAQSDTINVDSYKEAMDILYGGLDTSWLNTNLFINRAPVDSTFFFFDGKKDSALNYLEFLLHYNNIKIAEKDCNVSNPFLEIDSAASSKEYIPIGVLYFDFDKISDTALAAGGLDFANGQFSTASTQINPFETGTYFSICPMTFAVHSNTNFRLNIEFIFSNKNFLINTFLADFSDGLGPTPLLFNTDYQFNLTSGKNSIHFFMVQGLDTLKASCEIYLQSQDTTLEANRLLDFCNQIKPDIPIQSLVADLNYGLIKEGIPTGRFAVWLGCGNDKNGAAENSLCDIRKPYIVSGGFNPLRGKSLDLCSLSDLSNPNPSHLLLEFAIASALSGVISATTSGLVNVPGFAALVAFLYETDAYGGWRGPIYETYNGAYNNFFSPNEPKNEDNGTKYFEKLREEGYDIIIVTYNNPVDYLENNAAVLISLIKLINMQLRINGSKHELFVGGYSAGALTSRVALAEMERYYYINKGTPNEALYAHPHTRMFMSVEGEYQGANTPIGFQHMVNYLCNALTTTPIEILEVILARLTRKQFSNHTAKELTIWNYEATTNGVAAHQNPERDDFVQLQNSIGFPLSCRKVGIGQGNSKALPYSEIEPNENMFHIRSDLKVGGIFPFVTIGYYREYKAYYTPIQSSYALLASRKEGMSIKSFGLTIYINLISNFNKKYTYINNCKPYDECPGSLLAADRTFDNAGAKFLFGTLSSLANPMANNFYSHQGTNHSFAPTVSTLDLHNPANPIEFADLYFNLNANGLTVSSIDRTNNNNPVQSPNKDYGFPHLTFPYNHYAITPFDAIWSVGDNTKANNHFHVEDPQPLMCDFMVGEVSPENLYLSNRLINEPSLPYSYFNRHLNASLYSSQYQAAFEARKKIYCGNDIYGIPSYGSNGIIQPTKELSPIGDFQIGIFGDVEFVAGEEINLLPGFEAYSGSNFFASIVPSLCSNNFELNRNTEINKTKNLNLESDMPYSSKIDLIPNIKNSTKYTVYPIPTTESITIDTIEDHEKLQITIRDTYGKNLQRVLLSSGKNKIDLSFLSSGIYFLTIEKNGGFIQSQKIIINKQ
jgi:hypothetical protein